MGTAHPPLSRFLLRLFRGGLLDFFLGEEFGGGDVVVFPAAGLLGAAFLGAAFVFGIAFVFGVRGEFGLSNRC